MKRSSYVSYTENYDPNEPAIPIYFSQSSTWEWVGSKHLI